MHVLLRHGYAEGRFRSTILHRTRIEHGRIGGDAGVSIHSQRLVDARYQEQQTDPGSIDDVGERVEQVVTRQVGDRDVVIVEHDHEAGRATFWRNIGGAVGRRRAHQDEG